MASLTALNSALSGLKIAQSNISVISNNIANVNTAGYTRKLQEQQTVVIEGRAAGVSAGVIQRAVDAFLLRELNDQRAVAAGLQTSDRYYQQIQQFHGPAEQENAISNQIGKLKAALQALANDPAQDYLLNDVYQQASETVSKFHKFSDLITRLRNDAQNEMDQTVKQINALIQQIGDMNLQIKASFNVGRPTADLEDQRDIALAQLAEYIDVSYYERSDKVMVVQTQRGTPLVGDSKGELLFDPTTIGPLSYYPNSVAEIRLDDPVTGVVITDQANLGGKLGALIQMRDTVLPQYQAQLDEMAYRMAERFDSQGLKLFSLPNEMIPIDDPTQPPPNGYAGFSRSMIINPDVTADKTLIRSGTTGNTVSEGSSELVRKLIDFTFGDIAYQQATGTVDMSGASVAVVRGTVDINVYGSLDNHASIIPATNDTFSIALGVGAPIDIIIGAGDTAADLAATINGVYPGLATINGAGNLVLTSNQDITIADVNLGAGGMAALGLSAGTTAVADPDNLFGLLDIAGKTQIIGATKITTLATLDASDYINPPPSAPASDTFSLAIGAGAPIDIIIGAGDTAADLVNTINTNFPGLAQIGPNGNLILTSSEQITVANVNLGASGLSELGLTAGTYTPVNPTFTVQVGSKQGVDITILPTDTGDDLLAKLNAINGINASFTSPDGFLQFEPTEGGDITLTDGLGNPLAQMGIQVANIPHSGFKNANIGPDGSVSATGIGSSTTLVNYVTQMVSKQTQDAVNVESRITAEEVYRDTLERRLTDESGVNIDEEMTRLIQIQNNYAAAAKAIQVIEEMFNTLMNSVLR